MREAQEGQHFTSYLFHIYVMTRLAKQPKRDPKRSIIAITRGSGRANRAVRVHSHSRTGADRSAFPNEVNLEPKTLLFYMVEDDANVG